MPKAEELTNALIGEIKKDLEAEFKGFTEEFNSKNNPLGVEDAKEIINRLLAIALAKRDMMVGRLAAEVLDGDFFKAFSAKVKNIDNLQKGREIANIELEYAEVKYKKSRILLEKVEKQAVTNDFKRTDNDDVRPSAYDTI